MPAPQARQEPAISSQPRRSRPETPPACRAHCTAARNGITVRPRLEMCLLHGWVGRARIHSTQILATAANAMVAAGRRAPRWRGVEIPTASVTARWSPPLKAGGPNGGGVPRYVRLAPPVFPVFNLGGATTRRMAMPLDWTAQLLAQLTWHWDHHVRPRLDGLTDDEYFWEPVKDCWSIRPRAQARTAMAAGGGDLVADFEMPEPSPPPVTTIAWRLGHVIVGIFGARNAAHFGGPPMDYQTMEWPPDAARALALLDQV